ncbi:sodium-dependent phosphate transporter 1-B-like [Tropilaelaps mercedesae]|uniref:Sodium-dependent phosphate transporter 1-B-like n=1 Tax=Tropilaelaps mercedesae TaxID=418985 RepID=A0A1V9X9L5_9ACAR|nr:sodium-dependent phosphate transporter 1-B-like [Tropilaelaps mercedesae]
MTIVASWIASPILSGIISTATFFFILKCVVQTDEPAWNGLLFLPLFYFLTLFTNIFPVLLTGSSIIRFRQFPVWLAFIAAVCLAIGGALFVWFFFVPRLKFAIQNKVITGRENRRRPNNPVQNTAADLTTSTSDINATTSPGGSSTDDEPEVNELFSPLQVLTAIFGAFAHGGNDASNAISPLVTLWVIYRTGSVNERLQSPLFLFVFGGVGICVGFWVYGQKVITTVGEKLTKITASNGFSIEFGATATILMASKIGLPISTTHCKVGSIVCVGYLSNGFGAVNWALLKEISIGWIVTVLITALLSAAIMTVLKVVLI